MELKIYNRSGELKLTVSTSSSSTWNQELMKEYSVSVSFTYPSYVMLDVEDYVLLEGVKFSIKKEYKPKQKDTQTYSYSVKFYAPIHDAEQVMYLHLTDGDYNPQFSLDGSPREHLQKWVDNMNRLYGEEKWRIGDVIVGENRTIGYNNVSCWKAIALMAEEWGTEWWADGFTINLSRCEFGERVELGYQHGLTSLVQSENSSDVTFFTRLIPLGSTKNIDPSRYGFSRLQLPDRSKYVDRNTNYGLYEHVEEDAFAGIFPHYTGTVTAVRSEEKAGDDGNKFTVYYFKDSGMQFDPNGNEIAGLVKHVSFQTGNLAGRDFEANYDSKTGEWEIINTYPDDKTQIPGGSLIPAVGNEYIPWNFRMPVEYETQAELDYKAAVDDYLARYSEDVSKYGGDTDYIYIDRNRIPLLPGQRVRLLSDKYFSASGGTRDTRMTKVVRKLDNLSVATIECTNEVGAGWKSQVDSSLSELKYVVAQKLTQTIIRLLKTGDTEEPSEYTAFTSRRVLNEIARRAISKIGPDQTSYLVSFLSGAVFGKYGFAGGLAGYGAKIDGNGYGEMRGLRLWEWLEVPEFRRNRVEVYTGIKWRTPGAGIIESVEIDTDAAGNPLATGTVKLKLEKGEYGAVDFDDMAMGIIHYEDSSLNATEDFDDGKGNFSFAGFGTAYWRITEVSGSNNGTFRYALRPGTSLHPQTYMHFSCYGNFTNKDRQTSAYETRSYTRMLWKQNTWEISAANIAMQTGDLSNLNMHGMDMKGYSAYLNSVYFTGMIQQVKPDGTPIHTANDCGAWVAGTKHDFYDRVSHKGNLWLCVNEGGTVSEPSKDSPDWLLQVEKGGDGQGVSSLGPWHTGLIVPKNHIVTMGGSAFCSKVQTTNPPLWTVTDSQGRRILQTQDGGKTWGYILTGEMNSAEYDLLVESGSDGKDGTDGQDGRNGVSVSNVDVVYAISDSNVTAPTSGWQTDAPAWENGKYIWYKTITTYSEGAATETAPVCIPSGKGIDSVTEYYYLSASATSLTGGSWSTSRPVWQNGKYFWTKSVIRYTDGSSTETEAICVSGEKGDSITLLGPWHTGLIVPRNHIVTMGGSAFCSKVQTTNPPLWTVTDSQGRRILQTQDGGKTWGYILTGGMNSAEYELLVESGKDGKPGKDGNDGNDGEPGEKGEQGIQGCITRKSEWKAGVQYRNDEPLTSGTRYLDVALVRNNNSTTGWDAYKCKVTHTSTSSNSPGTSGGASYWEMFSMNVAYIYTSLVIAKDASIDFMQGNQLLIKRDDGTVTAGLSGSIAGSKVRIWAGSATPDNAPFRVLESGKTIGTDVELTGTINAISGKIGGFKIFGTSIVTAEGAYDGGTGNTSYANSKFFLHAAGASSAFLGFSATNKWVGIGLNCMPATSNMQVLGRFEDTGTSTYTYNKAGLYISIAGATTYDDSNVHGNSAIYIPKGHITGFRRRFRRVSVSTTLTNMDSIVRLVNTAEITVTLPSGAEDGQEIWLCSGNEKKVNVTAASGDTITGSGGSFASNRWHIYIYDAHNRDWVYGYTNWN